MLKKFTCPVEGPHLLLWFLPQQKSWYNELQRRVRLSMPDRNVPRLATIQTPGRDKSHPEFTLDALHPFTSLGLHPHVMMGKESFCPPHPCKCCGCQLHVADKRASCNHSCCLLPGTSTIVIHSYIKVRETKLLCPHPNPRVHMIRNLESLLKEGDPPQNSLYMYIQTSCLYSSLMRLGEYQLSSS